MELFREKPPLVQLEKIEGCACALVNHQLAWASIMNQDAKTLYLSLEDFIEKKLKEDKSLTEISRAPGMDKVFPGQDGKRRLYWDVLVVILNMMESQDDADGVMIDLRASFQKYHYDPKTLKAVFSFKPELVGSATRLTDAIGKACDNVQVNFGNLMEPYFDRLSEMAKNKDLYFTLATYYDDLYKLRMLTKICDFLVDHKQIHYWAE